MLFKRRFHQGIRGGRLDLTFRGWEKPRVKVGNRYRFGSSDFLEVDSVESTQISAIKDSEARRAGFANASELISALLKGSPKNLSLNSAVFRIHFHYVADHVDARAQLQDDTSSASLAEVAEKLHKMDARSQHGPWTWRVLELIEKSPRTAASLLAKEGGKERLAFKADVRKLKALGLTLSHEIGYELSERGKALLQFSAATKQGKIGK